MDRLKHIDFSAAALHIFAMAMMLCDHLWATVVSGNAWLTCLGRLAFPIFAFLIAEGAARTSNWRKYALRMLIFAVISEIPFNLMCGGYWFYPLHQNVLWTFLIALCIIRLNQNVKEKSQLVRYLVGISTAAAGYLLGYLTMVDYYGAGIAMVLVFYLFPERNWKSRIAQLLLMYYLNVEILGGFGYEVYLFGKMIFIPQQSFALFALIPIWLYQGRQGHHSRAFRCLCYGFYPAHMLILWLIGSFLIS